MGSYLSIRIAIYSGICLHRISVKIVEREKVNKPLLTQSATSVAFCKCASSAKQCRTSVPLLIVSEFFLYCTASLSLAFTLRQRKPSSIMAFRRADAIRIDAISFP